MDKAEELKIKRELIELEHKYRMEEIKAEREAKLEVQRIRSAEIRRVQERKDFFITQGAKNKQQCEK